MCCLYCEFDLPFPGASGGKSKSAKEWSPKCFEDLHDLPCIIIISGRERPGDTFPRLVGDVLQLVIDIQGSVYQRYTCNYCQEVS